MHALKNSFVVSGVSALVTVILAFIVALHFKLYEYV